MLNTSINISEEIVHRLRHIADCKILPPDVRVGLCLNLQEIIQEVLPVFSVTCKFQIALVLADYSKLLDKACEVWPNYSGDIAYPITIPSLNPYDLYVSYPDKWDSDTTYGNLRLMLTAHFADFIETEVSIAREANRLTSGV